MSLAYYEGGRLPHLHRVPVRPNHSNAHYLDRGSYSHQVLALAGCHDGQWVTGWPARECDETIPLKSILTYLAGVWSRVLDQLPGGRVLARVAKVEGHLNRCTMRRLLEEHFKELHGLATKRADKLGVKIRVVAVTFPNYLCSEETDSLFERYMDTLLDIIKPIWGQDLLYREFSEGQATSLYIMEQCIDVYSSDSRQERLEEIFKGLNTKGQQLNLVVVDSGGSTTNFQSLSVVTDESGEKILHSQSNVPDDMPTGSRGGSNTINALVEEQIRRKLQRHIHDRNLPSGQLAAMSLEFDRRKREFNHVTGVQPITFTCNLDGDKTEKIVIGGDVMKMALKAAFSPGLKLVKKEVRRAIGLGKDFAVIFCGGSYVNPGLWDQTKSMMETMRSEARQRGINMKWESLRDEQYWECAVSAGAALSMMHLPEPDDVLRGSAIGLQEISKENHRWVGVNEAGVLYFDYNRPSTVFDIDNSDPALRFKLRFNLVCDPLYQEQLQGPIMDSTLPPIRIEGERNVYGMFATYDLSHVLSPADLPKGTVRFRLSLLYDVDGDDGEVWKMPSLPFFLTAQRIDIAGRRVFDAKDGKWLLQVSVDPPTKLLRVESEVHRLPVWCSECTDEMVSARVCKVCQYKHDQPHNLTYSMFASMHLQVEPSPTHDAAQNPSSSVSGDRISPTVSVCASLSISVQTAAAVPALVRALKVLIALSDGAPFPERLEFELTAPRYEALEGIIMRDYTQQPDLQNKAVPLAFPNCKNEAERPRRIGDFAFWMFKRHYDYHEPRLLFRFPDVIHRAIIRGLSKLIRERFELVPKPRVVIAGIGGRSIENPSSPGISQTDIVFWAQGDSWLEDSESGDTSSTYEECPSIVVEVGWTYTTSHAQCVKYILESRDRDQVQCVISVNSRYVSKEEQKTILEVPGVVLSAWRRSATGGDLVDHFVQDQVIWKFPAENGGREHKPDGIMRLMPGDLCRDLSHLTAPVDISWQAIRDLVRHAYYQNKISSDNDEEMAR
ncbi:hypothetical protein PG993_013521 [Apiospora rasikravindrae]|uniref:Uncharacterized protein n=1 Tax=Apiospora rasikravindrae TaxID=990691 RepID=A0ABR1RXV5_9PEZI